MRRGAGGEGEAYSPSALPPLSVFPESKLSPGDPRTPDHRTKEEMLEELRHIQASNELMYGLPHRYGWKWYPWAREFYESRNKQNFLCAANQISKSSSQIRKVIEWATNQELWPQLWERPPSQFWYLYPSQDVVNLEFELKWEREFLPRGKYKADPVYGWEAIKERQDVKGVRFKSGVVVVFKTYSQSASRLQTGTVDAVFCDEELPELLYDELVMRLNATNGYFHMVFTATLGQDLWRRTMEPRDTEEEAFPTAAKWTISLYEAMFYEDKTPSLWTEERISGVKAKCKSHAEVQKRVYGRFVLESGRKYPTFDAKKHMAAPSGKPPENWLVFAGVDLGSGGAKNHPSAIVFLAVRPDRRKGRIFLGWRGDGVETTDSDVVQKYLDLKNEWGIRITRRMYDSSARDFGLIAVRMHEPFEKAERSHEIGEGLINTLFRNDMLSIDETEELGKLATELSCLLDQTDKKKAKDDFCDALRYAVTAAAWDLSGIVGLASDVKLHKEPELTPLQEEIRARRAGMDGAGKTTNEVEEELEEWNSAYG